MSLGRSLENVNEPRDLYDVVPELWELVRGVDAPLIHLLDGFLDAGKVTHGMAAHLLRTCNPAVSYTHLTLPTKRIV